MSLTIEVISDVVCPWCFIGKVKLQQALQMFKTTRPDSASPLVRWSAFQLNPDLPELGMPRDEYLARKFGERATGVYERIKMAGLEVGIEFAFDQIKRQPNTRKIHQLLDACFLSPKLQDALVQAFFEAYFLQGQDLTQDRILQEIAASVGMDPQHSLEALQSPQQDVGAKQVDQRAKELGVSGVPFFIFNQRLAVSGAQDAQALLSAMQEALV